MITISKSFTGTGVGAQLSVQHGDSFNYSVSGTFVGTVILERSVDGGQSFQIVSTITGSSSGNIVVETPNQGQAAYHFRCSAYTSGTIVTSLSDVAKILRAFQNSDGVDILDVTESGIALGGKLDGAQGADVASAATIDLDAVTGDSVDVTGTVTITAITLSVGRSRLVRFTGILTLTHGASLVLPGAANITTAAGDFARFEGYAAGVVRCVFYQAASGAATAIPDGSITNAKVNAAAAIAGSKLVAAASGVAGAVSTGSQTFTGVKTFETGQVVKGQTSGSAVAAGNIGEVLSSGAVGPTNAAASTHYGDLTSLTLNGHFLVSFDAEFILNASTVTKMYIGISTHTGDDGTGLVSGDNFFPGLPPTSGSQAGRSINQYEVNTSSATIYYAKTYAEFSAGTPQFRGRLTAVRIS